MTTVEIARAEAVAKLEASIARAKEALRKAPRMNEGMNAWVAADSSMTWAAIYDGKRYGLNSLGHDQLFMTSKIRAQALADRFNAVAKEGQALRPVHIRAALLRHLKGLKAIRARIED